jgi:hypothetical protein
VDVETDRIHPVLDSQPKTPSQSCLQNYSLASVSLTDILCCCVCRYKRLGGALALQHCLRHLREESGLIDHYILELLETAMTSLRASQVIDIVSCS